MRDTFAAQLTARGVGAIGVLLLAGPDAEKILAAVAFGKSPRHLAIGTTALCRISAAGAEDAGESPVDEALIVRTAESRFELHVHGGIAVMEAVKAALQNAGAKIVSTDEAAKLQLLETPRKSGEPAGPWGTMEAELLLALPHARTAVAAELLLHQPAAWEKWMVQWSRWLRNQTSNAELWRLQAAAQWALDRSRSLDKFLNPPRIAVLGPPNAGKSTLANALLGRRISITSEHAGTTRDWIDAPAVFTAPRKINQPPIDLAVTLVDTAGVRQTTDPLESESIARTHTQAAAADLIIAVFDAARPPEPAELALAQQNPARTVIAANKMDAVEKMPAALEQLGSIHLSAQTGAGLDVLMHAVLVKMDVADVRPGAGGQEIFAFNPRRKKWLTNIAESPDLARARQALLKIPSASVSE